MEELLATIRRAIDHDISELDRRAHENGQGHDPAPAPRGRAASVRATPEPQPAPLRGTLNEFRDKYRPDADADIARLRDRVKFSRQEDPPPLPPQPPRITPERSSTFSTILNPAKRAGPPLRGVRQAPPPPEPLPEPEYDSYQAPDEAVWQEQPQPQAYYPAPVQAYEPQQPGLMSPESSYAAHASFQALAQLALHQIGGDAGLQHMTREMLHSLLREWLDRNLPPLVEALVREEIERVARGGR